MTFNNWTQSQALPFTSQGTGGWWRTKGPWVHPLHLHSQREGKWKVLKKEPGKVISIWHNDTSILSLLLLAEGHSGMYTCTRSGLYWQQVVSRDNRRAQDTYQRAFVTKEFSQELGFKIVFTEFLRFGSPVRVCVWACKPEPQLLILLVIAGIPGPIMDNSKCQEAFTTIFSPCGESELRLLLSFPRLWLTGPYMKIFMRRNTDGF